MSILNPITFFFGRAITKYWC